MYLDEKYLFFTGSMLSNWAEGKFTATLPDGTETEFTSAEQHMMASKAVFFNDMESLEKIMSTNDPSRQKSIGRKVKNFKEDAWLDASFDIVAHGVYSKFSQIPEFREGLLETGDRILVEAAPWDKIWGIGMDMRHPDINDEDKWQGTNWLGKVLMRARKRIRTIDAEIKAEVDRIQSEITGLENSIEHRNNVWHSDDDFGAALRAAAEPEDDTTLRWRAQVAELHIQLKAVKGEEA